EMGEDVINKMEEILDITHKKSITEHLKIHGYHENPDFKNPLYFYGSDQEKIQKLINQNPKLGEFISEKLHILQAQVVFAVQNEFARTAYDFLARRTRAMFLDAKEAQKIAPKVIQIMAVILNKDSNWQEQELKNFNKVVKDYLVKI
ncbi:MAG TPA: FAD-dependent oxidoreductase, partial [Flavobacteriia bacterium]|nr:FAD-dependent oxidoreductase [Flavobacteriia bacterium]